MRKIRIFDNSFMGYSKSASLREENKDVSPTYFEWTDEGPLTRPTFFTDGAIKDVAKYGSAPGKIAWLLEPRCLRPENYEAAKENQAFFDVILSYDKEFISEIPNAKFYPFGGSSIAFDKWGIYPKSKDICMFVSAKEQTEGHQLRHQIAEQFGDRIDLYGAGVGKPVESKFEVLKDYRFEVVVESCFIDGYFSEKLIDPLSVGTMPIYYSHDNFYFSKYSPGLWKFTGLEYLSQEIDRIGDMDLMEFDADYFLAKRKIINNCMGYRIVEDNILHHYQELFE